MTKTIPDRTLDCLGFYCPMPVLKTREELDKMKVGEILELLTDDPAAESDIQYLTKVTGQKLLKIEKKGQQITFLIKKVK